MATTSDEELGRQTHALMASATMELHTDAQLGAAVRALVCSQPDELTRVRAEIPLRCQAMDALRPIALDGEPQEYNEQCRRLLELLDRERALKLASKPELPPESAAYDVGYARAMADVVEYLRSERLASIADGTGVLWEGRKDEVEFIALAIERGAARKGKDTAPQPEQGETK